MSVLVETARSGAKAIRSRLFAAGSHCLNCHGTCVRCAVRQRSNPSPSRERSAISVSWLEPALAPSAPSAMQLLQWQEEWSATCLFSELCILVSKLRMDPKRIRSTWLTAAVRQTVQLIAPANVKPLVKRRRTIWRELKRSFDKTGRAPRGGTAPGQVVRAGQWPSVAGRRNPVQGARSAGA